MEEQDGMRKSAVRLRYPRRHNETTNMRRPGDPGARARKTRTGRTAARSDDPAPTDTRNARFVPRKGGEVCSLRTLTNRHTQQQQSNCR